MSSARLAAQMEEAAEAFAAALVIFREFEDHYREGLALVNMGFIHSAADRRSEARAHFLQAADAYTRANAPDEAAEARAQAAALPD
ncbi:hypothetical protein ABZZ79_38980 [Streptomyces sp. NPDC006458]|uniref:hypothetical protein n=1 Tax=Streptomyces sp. NPDC006458 TaxID=3154302 RepID=UPI0033BDAB2E